MQPAQLDEGRLEHRSDGLSVSQHIADGAIGALRSLLDGLLIGSGEHILLLKDGPSRLSQLIHSV
jgi:hypothetical protein